MAICLKCFRRFKYPLKLKNRKCPHCENESFGSGHEVISLREVFGISPVTKKQKENKEKNKEINKHGR